MTVVGAALTALGILAAVALALVVEGARRPRWNDDDETETFRAKLEALRPR